MDGSKRTKKKYRKMNKCYCQGWMHPNARTLRRMMKIIDDIPNGSGYRKIGTWFEWN